MKKILSLFMLFVLCFVLVGCDDDGPIPYNYDSYQARQNLEELGNTSGFLIEYSMSFNDNMRMAKLYDDWDDINLDDYGDLDDYDDDDYDFDSMTITIGIKNNITYVSSGLAEIYIDFSDSSKVVVYMGMHNDSTGVSKWEKEELTINEFYSNDIYYTYSSMYEYLTPSNAFYQGSVMKKKTDVVCGRLCDKLTIADSSGYSSDSVDVYIDKELGICLKMMSNSIEKGETVSSGLECTRFEINPGIVLPNI